MDNLYHYHKQRTKSTVNEAFNTVEHAASIEIYKKNNGNWFDFIGLVLLSMTVGAIIALTFINTRTI